MILFHGGTEVIKVPRIIAPEVGRDFGKGFYTTDIEEQAIRWAQRKAKITRRYNHEVQATLNIYEFDESTCSALNIKHFPEASIDWLDMVIACRSNGTYVHGYDIVTGKIADDNVGETIQYILINVMRREDAVERLRVEKINNQICFCTENSLKYIKFIKSSVV